MNPAGITLAVAALACLGLLGGLLALVSKRFSQGTRLPVTAEWIDELSIERYRPMMSLLNSADLEFLRSQPGFTHRMEARVRAQRCQIFRGYLRSLNADFSRVCAAIKLLMLQSRYDRPDLAGILVKHQAMFAGGLILVHGKLLLYRAGICGVDVTSLVRTFDDMRRELRVLVPQTVSLGA